MQRIEGNIALPLIAAANRLAKTARAKCNAIIGQHAGQLGPLGKEGLYSITESDSNTNKVLKRFHNDLTHVEKLLLELDEVKKTIILDNKINLTKLTEFLLKNNKDIYLIAAPYVFKTFTSITEADVKTRSELSQAIISLINDAEEEISKLGGLEKILKSLQYLLNLSILPEQGWLSKYVWGEKKTTETTENLDNYFIMSLSVFLDRIHDFFDSRLPQIKATLEYLVSNKEEDIQSKPLPPIENTKVASPKVEIDVDDRFTVVRPVIDAFSNDIEKIIFESVSQDEYDAFEQDENNRLKTNDQDSITNQLVKAANNFAADLEDILALLDDHFESIFTGNSFNLLLAFLPYVALVKRINSAKENYNNIRFVKCHRITLEESHLQFKILKSIHSMIDGIEQRYNHSLSLGVNSLDMLKVIYQSVTGYMVGGYSFWVLLKTVESISTLVGMVSWLKRLQFVNVNIDALLTQENREIVAETVDIAVEDLTTQSKRYFEYGREALTWRMTYTKYYETHQDVYSHLLLSYVRNHRAAFQAIDGTYKNKLLALGACYDLLQKNKSTQEAVKSHILLHDDLPDNAKKDKKISTTSDNVLELLTKYEAEINDKISEIKKNLRLVVESHSKKMNNDGLLPNKDDFSDKASATNKQRKTKFIARKQIKPLNGHLQSLQTIRSTLAESSIAESCQDLISFIDETINKKLQKNNKFLSEDFAKQLAEVDVGCRQLQEAFNANIEKPIKQRRSANKLIGLLGGSINPEELQIFKELNNSISKMNLDLADFSQRLTSLKQMVKDILSDGADQFIGNSDFADILEKVTQLQLTLDKVYCQQQLNFINATHLATHQDLRHNVSSEFTKKIHCLSAYRPSKYNLYYWFFSPSSDEIAKFRTQLELQLKAYDSNDISSQQLMAHIDLGLKKYKGYKYIDDLYQTLVALKSSLKNASDYIEQTSVISSLKI